MDSDNVQWIKSSYNGGSGTECVETARVGAETAVRDSKDLLGPRLAFAARSWADFVGAVRAGRLG
ncbi:hypothetical protein GCM10020367_24590 [Streptomyces sannanensis]|uniref:DUF397 domain-containing protein n=1 Tax=Streptomyces sannanensis TaxID=285536 RepID=A0ABP6SAF8_9ACTN